jgi:hypothetical protein
LLNSGAHQELLPRKAWYWSLWRKQIHAERAAEQTFQCFRPLSFFLLTSTILKSCTQNPASAISKQ